MKKTYMMPSTEVFDVKIERLLTTGSELDIHTTPTGEDDTVDNPDDLLSRRHNDVWDDEEEDEEQ